VLDSFKASDIQVDTTNTATQDFSRAKLYASRVHGEEYIAMIEEKSKQTDWPERLNPFYSRMLIDKHSFDAAWNAIADWMESVDAALQGKPKFTLVRPPSHHACRANKGKGWLPA
jgi:acetoin utilization deacetylase AcuC-like enzyme